MRTRFVIASLLVASSLYPQDAGNAGVPSAALVEAPLFSFPGRVDSNSPLYWQRRDGALALHVLNSDGHPILSDGPSLFLLGEPREVAYESPIPGRTWMEAVLVDESGELYGYYHNEIDIDCGGTARTVPRIGAARSADLGLTWIDLGIFLEAPSDTIDCASPNSYFVGGVGDFSVVLDADSTYAYLFFSSYTRDPAGQGVGVARMLWSDRDEPRGRLYLWRRGIWEPHSGSRLDFTTLLPVAASWHAEDGIVDAFWGPSVHFNRYLEGYVMLLNRARDQDWTQEGIYVSFAASLEDPGSWSEPAKILDEGNWYPQVAGIERGQGTDKLAGQTARFFVGGSSRHLIVFTKP